MLRDQGSENRCFADEVWLAKHAVVGTEHDIGPVLHHPHDGSLLPEICVGGWTDRNGNLCLGTLSHVIIRRLAHMDHECGIQREHGVDVLTDSLADMDRKYLPRPADIVRYSLQVISFNIRYAWDPYTVGHGQNLVDLLRIILLGYRTSKNYRILAA